MTYTVALAGKGGTGKTTLACLVIKYMVKNGKTPILAVDADCNANLNEVLGLNIACTVGVAREEGAEHARAAWDGGGPMASYTPGLRRLGAATAADYMVAVRRQLLPDLDRLPRVKIML